jgi:leader peptidase (prepilin peptidase)/N-methyltransferase
LPAWLPPGSWRLGLATGLAGAVAPIIVLRTISFLFKVGRGKEGLGLGDADLMMMAGAFIGWQPILTAFFVGVFPGLFFGVLQLFRRGNQHFPFGPSLAMGVALTVLCWPAIGAYVRLFFFEPIILGFLGCGGPIMLLAASLLLRLVFGSPQPAQG